MSPRANAGMTLLEVSFTVAILAVVTGVLFSLSMGIGNAARVQEAGVEMSEGARNAMNLISTEVRQAQRLTISTGNTFPSDKLNYRVATDVDGNGTAVNKSGSVELSAVRTIQRDVNDLNADGLAGNQLIVAQGTTVLRVLANNVSPNTETATDANGNGRIDRGFWVTSSGSTLTISVQTEEQLNNGRTLATTYSAVVRPRN